MDSSRKAAVSLLISHSRVGYEKRLTYQLPLKVVGTGPLSSVFHDDSQIIVRDAEGHCEMLQASIDFRE